MIRRCGRIAPGSGSGPATGQPGLAEPARIAARREILSRLDRPAMSGRGGSGVAVSDAATLAIVSPGSRSIVVVAESAVRVTGLGGVSTCTAKGAESGGGVNAASVLSPFSAGSAAPESGVTVRGGAVHADVATDTANVASSSGARGQRLVKSPAGIMQFTLTPPPRRGNAGHHFFEAVTMDGCSAFALGNHV